MRLFWKAKTRLITKEILKLIHIVSTAVSGWVLSQKQVFWKVIRIKFGV